MIQKTVSKIRQMLASASENTIFDDVMIHGVCIDSRLVEEGNLFIPLKGERVNGHAYAAMAIEKGAAALLWEINEPDPPADIAVIFVEDCAKALWQLAGAYRTLCKYKAIGITGSNGKTSTKDMVAGVLSEQFKVMKTQGNHNNEIGVPLTLLSFDEDIDVAVVEMGMENLHEIKALCEIVKPDIGIITNVGVAHLENLGSMENIAKAKCELIEGIQNGGTFFYNGDDPYLAKEVCSHDLSELSVKTFGEGAHNSCALTSFKQNLKGIAFKHSMSKLEYHCNILGRHQAMNGCAAYLAAHELGMCDEAIKHGFTHVVTTSMRNELSNIGRWTVLNDAYKSNPQSALAALSTFDQVPGDNRIAVLGDMLELGETSPALHEQLGRDCANFKLDKVFCLGEMAEYIAKGASAAGIKDVRHFIERDELLSALLDEADKAAAVLFKGSRGMKLDEILDQIKDRLKKMEKIKLAVIFGGKSSEYSVSLHSAESLLSHCDQNKYELILIGITEKGKWLHYPKLDFDAVAHDTWHQDADCREVVLSPSSSRGLLEITEEGFKQLPVDVIFPCLHGPNGEDGTIQGLFELADIPYVGCGPLASSCGMDKEFTHILCENAGVVCAPYMCIYQENSDDLSEVYQQAVTRLGVPMFIKPANAGSSYGISKINSEEEFIKGMEFAFKYDHKVLVEAAIDGFEIGCAVLGNHELMVGECDEIDTKNSFFDFAAKYALENTRIHCPARISQELSNQAKAIAKKVYRTMNCSGMCRVDMFINSKQEIIFNEVNTIPGFTATSRYPSMMKAAGVPFDELIDRLVQLALEK